MTKPSNYSPNQLLLHCLYSFWLNFPVAVFPIFHTLSRAHSIFQLSWAEDCFSKRLSKKGKLNGCRGNRGNKYATRRCFSAALCRDTSGKNSVNKWKLELTKNGIFPGKAWLWWSDQGRRNFMNSLSDITRSAFGMSEHPEYDKEIIKEIECLASSISRASTYFTSCRSFFSFAHFLPVKAFLWTNFFLFIYFSFRFTMCKYYEWENKRRYDCVNGNFVVLLSMREGKRDFNWKANFARASAKSFKSFSSYQGEIRNFFLPLFGR